MPSPRRKTISKQYTPCEDCAYQEIDRYNAKTWCHAHFTDEWNYSKGCLEEVSLPTSVIHEVRGWTGRCMAWEPKRWVWMARCIKVRWLKLKRKLSFKRRGRK